MKILLGYDASEFSESALCFIKSHFRAGDTEVLVLSAVEAPYYAAPPMMAPAYSPEMDEIFRVHETNAKSAAAKVADDLRATGFAARFQVNIGEPGSEIIRIAEDWKCDLIVVGSHGRRRLEKLLLGSVSESVARHAHCSVLIVRMA